MTTNINTVGAEFGYNVFRKGIDTLTPSSWFTPNSVISTPIVVGGAWSQWHGMSHGSALDHVYICADICAAQFTSAMAGGGEYYFTDSFVAREFNFTVPAGMKNVTVEFELVYINNFFNVDFNGGGPKVIINSDHFDTSSLSGFIVQSVSAFKTTAMSSAFPPVFATAISTFVTVQRFSYPPGQYPTATISEYPLSAAEINDQQFGINYLNAGVENLVVGTLNRDAALIDRIQSRYYFTAPASGSVNIKQVKVFDFISDTPEFGYEGFSLTLKQHQKIDSTSTNAEFGYELFSTEILQINRIGAQNASSEYGYELFSVLVSNNSKNVDAFSSEYGFELFSVATNHKFVTINDSEFGYEDSFVSLTQHQIFGMQDSSSEYGFEEDSSSVRILRTNDPFSAEFGFESSCLILRTFVNRPETVNPYVNFPLPRVIHVDSYPRTHTVKPGERLLKPKGAFRTRIPAQIADRRIIALPTG